MTVEGKEVYMPEGWRIGDFYKLKEYRTVEGVFRVERADAEELKRGQDVLFNGEEYELVELEVEIEIGYGSMARVKAKLRREI